MIKGNVLCVAFRDADGKKPVQMLSTALAAHDLPSGRLRLFNSYNRNMGAVCCDNEGLRRNKTKQKTVEKSAATPFQ